MLLRSVLGAGVGGLGLALGLNSTSRASFRGMTLQAQQGGPSFHGFTANNIDGEKVSLEEYRGKVCIVVNVASRWGKTKVNYTQLVSLHSKYGGEAGKLAILAFPCNQFGAQEPGSNQEIKNFAREKFNAKFDLFEKVDVNGNKAHPLFVFLREKQGGLLGSAIKWNFTKFVIDPEGNVVARFGPLDDPIPKVEDEIKKHL